MTGIRFGIGLGSRNAALALIALAVAALTTSCDSGPAAPVGGTPAYYWAAARTAYAAGDYLKTTDQLQRILATENEYTSRARTWDTVINAGLVQGYADYADSWESGGRMNRANPAPFRKQASSYRSLAGQSALQFTQDIATLLTAPKDARIQLSFGSPAGNAAWPGGLKRIGSGILIPDTENESLLKSMLQRGVLLSACSFVGKPDDLASCQERLKAGEYLASRDVFLLASARALNESAELFTSTKLDHPGRLQIMSDQATKALGLLPESKDTKALADKIQARLKKSTGSK
jgi:hypothetical protein